jgi:hypothetical protein
VTLAAILAMPVQTGVCAQNNFRAPDGVQLTVIVCPVLSPPEIPDLTNGNRTQQDGTGQHKPRT